MFRARQTDVPTDKFAVLLDGFRPYMSEHDY